MRQKVGEQLPCWFRGVRIEDRVLIGKVFVGPVDSHLIDAYDDHWRNRTFGNQA